FPAHRHWYVGETVNRAAWRMAWKVTLIAAVVALALGVALDDPQRAGASIAICPLIFLSVFFNGRKLARAAMINSPISAPDEVAITLGTDAPAKAIPKEGGIKSIVRRALIVVWLIAIALCIAFYVDEPKPSPLWGPALLLCGPTWAAQFIFLGI